MIHYIYILQSLKDFKYFIGETADVEAMLRFHNAGLQLLTRSRIPFKIIHTEIIPDRSIALKRKRELKSWKGGNKFKDLINGCSPAWQGISFGIKGRPDSNRDHPDKKSHPPSGQMTFLMKIFSQAIVSMVYVLVLIHDVGQDVVLAVKLQFYLRDLHWKLRWEINDFSNTIFSSIPDKAQPQKK
jgi:putative endonuclease